MITIKRGSEHLNTPGSCVIVGDYKQYEFPHETRPNAWHLRYGQMVYTLTTCGYGPQWFVPARTAFSAHLTNSIGGQGAYADFPAAGEALQDAIAAAVAYVEACEASHFQLTVDGKPWFNQEFMTLSAAQAAADALARNMSSYEWIGVVRMVDGRQVYELSR
ncbi:hypothetical protein GCM10008955_35960 [Deinococcus malanensis]|uniref:Uncharacterized protein n=1 Tax=Deinococcus malanensis TaxID=1706855 RepID=A0ABQ2F1G6_9DEIO|nr:hypothetical protein [Deinococcus malanensis]GGK38929.1 hypothetical protein GCM10008955_35960 [Deinococcus malanensis]